MLADNNYSFKLRRDKIYLYCMGVFNFFLFFFSSTVEARSGSYRFISYESRAGDLHLYNRNYFIVYVC